MCETGAGFYPFFDGHEIPEEYHITSFPEPRDVDALMVRIGQPPEKIRIENSLEGIESVIEGTVCAYPLSDETLIVTQKEDKRIPNHALLTQRNMPRSAFVGIFYCATGILKPLKSKTSPQNRLKNIWINWNILKNTMAMCGEKSYFQKKRNTGIPWNGKRNVIEGFCFFYFRKVVMP